ncbi:PBS lyase HEAT domain-containing protein [Aspergillus oryzae]|uniref:PBS lyase HEAT domain-containing protein n=1 Tax=Aspergillus oryzae TaxID=5062 RepID=A0A1S9DQ99_ASPOZ|nr:PBS lyase HEAT domain-containing protein [Aspergillus oryzae]
MTEINTFDLLDSINWSALRHAYGSAWDVPAQLRALRSGNAEIKENAQRSLCGNIFHQGDRYEATAYAVPCLLKVLEDSSSSAFARVFLISLLVHLALGYADTFLPNGVNFPEWQEFAEKKQGLEFEAEMHQSHEGFVNRAKNHEERASCNEFRNRMLEKHCRRAKDELAAYKAVKAGVPVFQTCLDHYRLLEKEEDTVVLASAIISLGLLNGRFDDARPEGIDGLVSRLRSYSTDTRPLVRWAAAVALIRLRYEEPEHVDTLISILADRSFKGLDARECSARTSFPFQEGDVAGYSVKVLGTINADDYPGAVTAIFDALPGSSGLGIIMLLEGLLALVFGPEPEHMKVTPFEQLSLVQQLTVAALTGMDDKMWERADSKYPLDIWNIPAGS